MANRDKPPFPSVIEARFKFLFDKWSQQVRVHKAHFRLLLGGYSSFSAPVSCLGLRLWIAAYSAHMIVGYIKVLRSHKRNQMGSVSERKRDATRCTTSPQPDQHADGRCDLDDGTEPLSHSA